MRALTVKPILVESSDKKAMLTVGAIIKRVSGKHGTEVALDEIPKLIKKLQEVIG